MSLKEIRNICIKRPACIFVYPFRYISTIFTSFLIKTNITPTKVTIISFIFSILAAINFATGEYKYTILGAIFLQIAFILDLIDGEIARYKNLKSEFGGWLDSISDNLMLFAVCVGIAIGSFIQYKNPLTLILGILAYEI